MKSSRYLRSRIYSASLRLLAEACSDMIGGGSRRSALLRMRSGFAELRSTVGMTGALAKPVWLALLGSFRRASRSLWGAGDPNAAAYGSLQKEIARIESAVFRSSKAEESRLKSEYLEDLTSSGVFYVCSKHGGCASDHEAYQGRVYVSSDWKERCPEDLVERVGSYIEKHGVLTVEEVTQGGPYLVTRPNCRHSLRRVPTKAVLEGGWEAYVKEGSDAPDAYVYSRYRAHRDRLKALIQLRGVCPCEKLEKDLAHTRGYMKKWLSVLRR